MIISAFDRVENIVGKGEIALYEQFLLFPQCFQKACSPGVSKGVIVWKWVNSHISVVVCSFFEFGNVSKWCLREWVKQKVSSGFTFQTGFVQFFRAAVSAG